MTPSDINDQIERARRYSGKSPAELIQSADELLHLADSEHSTRARAAALTIRAHAHRIKGEFAAALDLTSRAVAILEHETDPVLIDSYHVIAVRASILFSERKVDEALSGFERMAEIASIERDQELEARAIAAQAQALIILKRADEALQLSMRAFDLFVSINNDPGVASTSAILGLLQMERKNYAAAVESQHRALKYFHEMRDVKNVVAAEINIGKCLMELGKLTSALPFLQSAYSRAEREGLQVLAIRAATLLAACFKLTGEIEHAIQMFGFAIAQSQQIGQPELGFEAIELLESLTDKSASTTLDPSLIN